MTRSWTRFTPLIVVPALLAAVPLLFRAEPEHLIIPSIAPRLSTDAPGPSAGAGDKAHPDWAGVERKLREWRNRGTRQFDQPQDAHEFFLQQRLPSGQTALPIEKLQRARDDIRQRQAAKQARQVAGPPSVWTALGPGNIGGRTRAIVFDETNPDTIYAAGVAGGIWKSTNGGATWNVADDTMLNLAVSTIAIDPTDPNVLYAGTGEGYFAGPMVQGLGIFKSLDAGTTWNQLPGTVAGVPTGAFYWVNDIVISPNDHNRIYAATRYGVWRSLDAGQTWSIVLSNPTYSATPPTTAGCNIGCTDLAIRTDRDPDVLFACFGSHVTDGLYRSDDGGNSWVDYTMPAEQGRMRLAIAPSDNDVIYLSMAQNQTGSYGKLYTVFRTVDGGSTWESRVDFETLTGEWLFTNLSTATGCIEYPPYHQGWYDQALAVDPADPDIVWTGGIDIFRSDDGGQNWGIAGYWMLYRTAPPEYIHADIHTIVFHPDYDGTTNQIMYVGNDGGLFRTLNARAATSQEDCPLPPDEPIPDIAWENMNNGYGVTQFYHGDSGVVSDVFVGGAQDNGTSRVQAVGTPNAWEPIYGGDGGYVAIDPTDSQTMYVEIQGFPTILKSVDGGDSFVDSFNGITDTDGVFITPFAMDQSDPEVLWTGGSRPWRTTDGAANWELAGPDFAGPDKISAIAIAPSNSNVVYLGFSNGYIVRTTNALDPSPSWDIFSNGLVGSWVSSVAVDPADPDVAYCTYSNYGVPHILTSDNGGLLWTSIDGLDVSGVPDIPAHWIAIRPTDPNELFVGSELGVFRSPDRGGVWEVFNEGLANTVVESLDFKNSDTLVAFTHGRGAFMRELAPAGPVPSACCLPDDSCELKTQEECSAMGGVFLSESDTCDGVDCDAAIIPTVSQWGVLVMLLLILSGGTIVLRRRRSAPMA